MSFLKVLFVLFEAVAKDKNAAHVVFVIWWQTHWGLQFAGVRWLLFDPWRAASRFPLVERHGSEGICVSFAWGSGMSAWLAGGRHLLERPRISGTAWRKVAGIQAGAEARALRAGGRQAGSKPPLGLPNRKSPGVLFCVFFLFLFLFKKIKPCIVLTFSPKSQMGQAILSFARTLNTSEEGCSELLDVGLAVAYGCSL